MPAPSPARRSPTSGSGCHHLGQRLAEQRDPLRGVAACPGGPGEAAPPEGEPLGELLADLVGRADGEAPSGRLLLGRLQGAARGPPAANHGLELLLRLLVGGGDADRTLPADGELGTIPAEGLAVLRQPV